MFTSFMKIECLSDLWKLFLKALGGWGINFLKILLFLSWLNKEHYSNFSVMRWLPIESAKSCNSVVCHGPKKKIIFKDLRTLIF